MDDFAKYEELHNRGVDPREVYRVARADGLDRITSIRLLRKVFGLSFVEAKKFTGMLDILDSRQKLVQGGTVYWEGATTAEGFYIIEARLTDGMVYVERHRKYRFTDSGSEEVSPGMQLTSLPIRYFDQSLAERISESIRFARSRTFRLLGRQSDQGLTQHRRSIPILKMGIVARQQHRTPHYKHPPFHYGDRFSSASVCSTNLQLKSSQNWAAASIGKLDYGKLAASLFSALCENADGHNNTIRSHGLAALAAAIAGRRGQAGEITFELAEPARSSLPRSTTQTARSYARSLRARNRKPASTRSPGMGWIAAAGRSCRAIRSGASSRVRG